MASSSTEWAETLIKMARPDIYRINAFRILNLPVTASNKEIKSQVRKNELIQKYANTKQCTTDAVFPVNAPDDNDLKNEALQRLLNPELRFIDEFFWFWPISLDSKLGNDEALIAIRKNNITEALSIWKKREANGSEFNISTHNIAVYYHAIALDLEGMETRDTSPSREKLDKKRSYWKEALNRWRKLQNNELFWDRLQKRIDDLVDPRINNQTLLHMREGLPELLLLINATLAIEAAEMDDFKDMEFHISMMRQSGYSANTIYEATQKALIPIRNKIKIMCANAHEEAEKSTKHGHSIADNLIKTISKPLFILDKLLPVGDSARETTHDEIALQIRECIHAYAGTTENWDKASKPLKKALEIAESTSIRKKIEEDANAIENIIKYTTCWFCGKHPSDARSSIKVAMHGNVQKEREFLETKVRWQRIDVPVPRCRKCEDAHKIKTRWGRGGAIVGLVSGILLGIALNEEYGFIPVAIAVFAIVSGVAWLFSLVTFPPDIKSESHKNKFPTVQEMIQKGWGIGEKPSGVS